MADDIDRLALELRAFPLIHSADLNWPGAAYQAFEIVLSAILRAALIEVPADKRKGANGDAFKRFVTQRFPEGRGRGDDDYARELWELRNYFVKERRTTSGVALTHFEPDRHLVRFPDGLLIINLESLMDDFRVAVHDLGDYLRSSPELRELARAELEQREMRVVVIADWPQQNFVTFSTLAASASSATPGKQE